MNPDPSTKDERVTLGALALTRRCFQSLDLSEFPSAFRAYLSADSSVQLRFFEFESRHVVTASAN